MRTAKIVLAFATATVILGGIAAIGLVARLRSSRAIHPVTKTRMTLPGDAGDATLLFNGWKVSPAGRHIKTGDMLLGSAISPDGSMLAIVSAGYNQHALHIIDFATEKEIAAVKFAKAWNGIAWSPAGDRVYVSAGIANALNDIHVVERSADGWAATKGFQLTGNDPKKTAISGLSISKDGSTLFALNNSDNCVYALKTSDGTSVSRTVVGDHPVVCRTSNDGKLLYVADWGGAEVAVLDIAKPTDPKIETRIPTGEHPNDLALSHDGRLFVSCGNADAVTIVDTLSRKPIETVKTTLTTRSPYGSTPNALALTQDNRTLYVANADNNDVCVIDVSRRGMSRVAGFIPAGWYPSAVAVNSDGTKLVIGSGKGTGTGSNLAKLPISQVVPSGFAHMGKQLTGLISFVDAPNEEQLDKYTRQVHANTPYRDSQLAGVDFNRQTAIPRKIGDPSPIKHVLYIIKENRTYDQVFGDMGKGNGDPNLCLFGKDVTPNHHALAEQFVLLDNLYCSGEVSADGHPWSTSAYATDFTQRSWVLSYSGHGGTVHSDSVADPKGGYIWDACNRKGLTYRSYGEYVYASSSEAAPEQKVAGSKGLIGHGSPKWVGIGRPKDSPAMRDIEKADVFIEEFKEFEKNGEIPRFMIMSLGENHTEGTRPGAFTPKSHVASNDVALGKIIEAISHSSAWKEFAIFVIEDDAQNGPDHVDSHRTCGLLISPYVRRGSLDSTMYSTASMLRTMELILGLNPLTQYDAAATPMSASFTTHADLAPFTLVPAKISLNDRNGQTAYGARQSAKMDFSEYDRIDEAQLNRILWHSIKGANTPMPAPTRRAIVTPVGNVMKLAIRDKSD